VTTTSPRLVELDVSVPVWERFFHGRPAGADRHPRAGRQLRTSLPSTWCCRSAGRTTSASSARRATRRTSTPGARTPSRSATRGRTSWSRRASPPPCAAMTAASPPSPRWPRSGAQGGRRAGRGSDPAVRVRAGAHRRRLRREQPRRRAASSPLTPTRPRCAKADRAPRGRAGRRALLAYVHPGRFRDHRRGPLVPVPEDMRK